jgi:hypothetical protein
MIQEESSKSAGGHARAEALSPDQRKEIARKAAAERWRKDIPQATHAGVLEIATTDLPCYVLNDGTRVLSTRGIMKALGRTWRGRKYSGTELPVFVEAKNLNRFIDKDLAAVLTPLEIRTERGTKSEAFRAEVLTRVCDLYLRAREEGALTEAQMRVAQHCEVLVRAFSTVGIIALVDEATGYQRDRAKDALATILQAFIAKELQPWVHTFPEDFYSNLYRLRGMNYPADSAKRPQYFGHLTNNIVYQRLAPKVLDELKKATPRDAKGRHKQQLHRRLTTDVGHPKLREHLASVVSLMKISDTYDQFETFLDRAHPKLNHTLPLPFGGQAEPDSLPSGGSATG